MNAFKSIDVWRLAKPLDKVLKERVRVLEFTSHGIWRNQVTVGSQLTSKQKNTSQNILMIELKWLKFRSIDFSVNVVIDWLTRCRLSGSDADQGSITNLPTRWIATRSRKYGSQIPYRRRRYYRKSHIGECISWKQISLKRIIRRLFVQVVATDIRSGPQSSNWRRWHFQRDKQYAKQHQYRRVR